MTILRFRRWLEQTCFHRLGIVHLAQLLPGNETSLAGNGTIREPLDRRGTAVMAPDDPVAAWMS
jgi:hypothetical protein